jgi:hypothetical protein
LDAFFLLDTDSADSAGDPKESGIKVGSNDRGRGWPSKLRGRSDDDVVINESDGRHSLNLAGQSEIFRRAEAASGLDPARSL